MPVVRVVVVNDSYLADMFVARVDDPLPSWVCPGRFDRWIRRLGFRTVVDAPLEEMLERMQHSKVQLHICNEAVRVATARVDAAQARVDALRQSP